MMTIFTLKAKRGMGGHFSTHDVRTLGALKRKLEGDLQVSELYRIPEEQENLRLVLGQVNHLISGTRAKRNPRKKTKKVPWSASDIRGMQEFHDRKMGWQKIPHQEFPRYSWSPSSDVTYTVKRMYGSMFADQHDHVYSVTRKGPRATTEIHSPGVDSKHINKLSDAKAFAEKDFKKRVRKTRRRGGPITGFDGIHAFADKTGEVCKVAKKKATRKKTPPYQLLINRCHKLWTHYCERPSKKRLEAIYVHLDKKKESTSKKVATERRRCLRAANAEAKRIKLKK